MATNEQIINKTYNALGEPSDAPNYDLTTVVQPKINDVINRICKGEIRDIFIPDMTYKAGDLPFTRQMAFYQLVKPVALGADITTASTTITIDTTYFATASVPSPKRVSIDGNIITYTSKSATQLTGVTGIEIAHYSGTYVYQLYDIPANTSQPFTMFWIGNKGATAEIKYNDTRLPKKYNPVVYYSIVQDNSGNSFLDVRGFTSQQPQDLRMQLYYYLNSTDMALVADVCVIPDPWAIEIVPQIAAGELLFENEEYSDAQKATYGYRKLTEMYSYYSKLVKRNQEVIRPTPMSLATMSQRAYGQNGRGYRNR